MPNEHRLVAESSQGFLVLAQEPVQRDARDRAFAPERDGATFSALLVRYRDVRYVLPFLLQLWMFVTPVIYPVSFIPEDWQWLVWLNPMSGFVSAIRTALFDTPLEPAGVAVSTVVACVLLTFAVWYFRRVERALADFI